MSVSIGVFEPLLFQGSYFKMENVLRTSVFENLETSIYYMLQAPCRKISFLPKLKSRNTQTPGLLPFRSSSHTALLPLCSKNLTSTGFGAKASLLSQPLAEPSQWEAWWESEGKEKGNSWSISLSLLQLVSWAAAASLL